MGSKKTPAEEAQVDAEVRPENEQPAAEASASDAGAQPPAEQTPPAAEKRAEPKGPELLTPEAWASKLGHARKPSPLRVSNRISKDPVQGAPRFSAQHSAADHLHGWSAHALHTAEKLTITREAYEAALAAALAPVALKDADGKPTGAPKYRPHEAALSPFSPRGNAQ